MFGELNFSLRSLTIKPPVSQDYAELHKVLAPGKAVAIDDGLLSLTVEQINGTDVVCRVNNTVMLGETKGINLPGTPVTLPAITEKDKGDLIFGVQQVMHTCTPAHVVGYYEECD
jgi:pyruvate kinase